MLTRRRTGSTPSVPLVILATLVATAMLSCASAAYACEKDVFYAAAKYAQCELKAVGRAYSSDAEQFQRQLSNCRMKYVATWAKKLQAKCNNSDRLVAGVGVVFDRLTSLEWEQKDNLDDIQNLANPHDADNQYTWSLGDLSSTAADGTIYTDFLATLNSAPCFAGQCDWRLPTRAELQTILAQRYPCTTSPCITPIFGPTAALFYYSATSTYSSPSFFSPVAWEVLFGNGSVEGIFKSIAWHVRAVRGGL